ncbi:MAG TPA: TetR/AcrR family transcriptional regulator [Spongiibacteraceae bacterium]|jgi:AcrR family transcriptional regulator|nr:TetR/AcrR family transcriptional regulator [Spongiibacteraceae bacterium]HUH38711.1 TetR/AcrR family transcriptional regulator [Spongiibacteraceae bacterium]
MTNTVAKPGRQALKTRLTRERIINAVVSLITTGGYSAASSSRIAKRAGVTWGAVQHHFGSKDDILDAVIELSHDRFTELMATEVSDKGTLADRVERFVDLMWQNYQSDVYLASLEILLARRAGCSGTNAGVTKQQAESHIGTLRRIFPELDLSDTQLIDILGFIHILLTGLTIERAFEEPIKNEEKHMRRIKAAMLTMLST